MPTMFTRILEKPNQSILLIGPRGTGKSTWIRKNFKTAPNYNLLNTEEAIRLSQNPHTIYHELKNLPPNSWVVIDEIQKAPALLDEVHCLIEENHLRFVLSGSSARKLKKGHANLLAGRALMTPFFPLVSAEIGKVWQIPSMILQGLLPRAVVGPEPQAYLKTYAETYLSEEIKAEALTKNLGHFARFLEIAARQNGQTTNVSNIARDAGVARQTVQGYFDILVDTLMGYWLPAWKLKNATKQIAHSKFYFFDSGIVRALQKRLPYPATQEELGPLLETTVLHELRAYLSYHKLDYPLYYWSTPDRVEIDIVFESTHGYVALEIKAAKTWVKGFNKGFLRIQKELGSKVRCIGIYLGERMATWNHITVFPLPQFLEKLWQGEW